MARPRTKKTPSPPPEPKQPLYVWPDRTSRSQGAAERRRQPSVWCLEDAHDRNVSTMPFRVNLRRPRENEARFDLEVQFGRLYKTFSLDADYELAGRDREAIERAADHALLLIEQSLLNDLNLIREIRASKPRIEARLPSYLTGEPE